ncbi:hypothetical protein P7C73_g6507, partial [Tremellales sp. Uapishka_1]
MDNKTSTTILKSAQAASSSPHALINLARLVRSLDEKDPGELIDEDENGGSGHSGWVFVRRDWETVLYARALLDALKGGNEQSSSTSTSLVDIESTLRQVESKYRDVLKNSTAPSSSSFSARIAPKSVLLPDSTPSSPAPSPASASTPPPSRPLVAPQFRKRMSTATSQLVDYLAVRAREDAKGDETGLLPLRAIPTAKPEIGAREKLLGGTRNGVGSAQLHEELGGQLADMSHQLKLNAIHFATTLENEKSTMEDAQTVLEKNLVTTRSSKKDLSSVSKKGRGTTCLTFGVIILVMVIWIWVYMLIRFT